LTSAETRTQVNSKRHSDAENSRFSHEKSVDVTRICEVFIRHFCEKNASRDSSLIFYVKTKRYKTNFHSGSPSASSDNHVNGDRRYETEDGCLCQLAAIPSGSTTPFVHH